MTMYTAVQLRATRPRCALLHGTPCRVATGSLGQVAVFAARQVVAYLLEPNGARRRLFVFRTAERREGGTVALPGVRLRVQLLLDSSSSMRIDRVEQLFGYLAKNGWDVS